PGVMARNSDERKYSFPRWGAIAIPVAGADQRLPAYLRAERMRMGSQGSRHTPCAVATLETNLPPARRSGAVPVPVVIEAVAAHGLCLQRSVGPQAHPFT